MPNVSISTDHPDSASPLLRFAAEALVAMGARVEIAQGGENLVRALRDPGPTPGGPTSLVQAEGLPNLLHELAHAVQAGRLGDDYGIDYTAIPFDLDTVAGRAVLWDELCCCVTSCAYLWTHGRAARAGAPPAEIAAEVEAWFREQVGIQPVFYGMEGDPGAFVARVGALLGQHRAEAEGALARAYAGIERALTSAGADATVAAAAWRPSIPSLWSVLGWGHSAAPAAGSPAAPERSP